VKLSPFQGGVRVAAAAVLILAIALMDWHVDLPLAFGFLYLGPILLVGTVWPRSGILATATLCAFLSHLFAPPFARNVSLPEDFLVFIALAGTGLFAFEISRTRARELATLRRVESEVAARRSAEEQLEFLIESSPVAILTMAADGIVLRANQAAHKLFGLPGGALAGQSVQRYLPALGRVPCGAAAQAAFRTTMQCRGERSGGEVFLADVFFSTYQTAIGPRLAALVVDASEQLREREESGLEQLLAGSRILVGAVSHEIRNVCGAIAVIHENLARSGALRADRDFEALGSLVETLTHIAAVELKQSRRPNPVAGVDLFETLDELRIVLEPYCRDAGIDVHWRVPEELPPVWADRHSLLQVLLNLIQNSERALDQAAAKRIDIDVSTNGRAVLLRVTDSGPGISATEKLFQPFQPGAQSTGLGLFLSRAFVRSFHGELRHDPTVAGCSFVIELAVAGPNERASSRMAEHGTHPITAA
jgi:PAS domain S-box-containing protein